LKCHLLRPDSTQIIVLSIPSFGMFIATDVVDIGRHKKAYTLPANEINFRLCYLDGKFEF
ncbi:MAG: hypothetical protein OIF58_01595, partial [Cohaesibacter sp.]|nr:hypothetical protein [Cohaesibacter sp.]